MKERIDDILAKLGLEEKAALCSRRDMWTTKEFEALGIPSVMLTVNHPEKELKGFAELSLAPGEATDLSLTLDKRAFAYYIVPRIQHFQRISLLA